MDEQFKDMESKGLIRVQRFDALLKKMCDSGMRLNMRFGGALRIEIFDTELYELNIVEKEYYGIDRRN